MSRPSSNEYAPFYETYISLVPEADLQQAMKNSIQEMKSFLESIPRDKADYAYAPGKWSIKQLIQHVVDAERVFAYRALCVARGEKQNLPGFDENEYARTAEVSHRNLADLGDEFVAVRISSIRLFNSFTPEALVEMGTANGKPITARALGFIIIGHWRHHQRILRERYL